MEKLLTFASQSDRGIFTYLLDTEHDHLIKTAAEFHPEVAAYINNAKPIPGKVQVLLTALGAYEFWGDNNNGDAFFEADLDHSGDNFGYRTFKRYAKAYKHHVNKDPAASYGDVTLSVYNNPYHRVELIISVDTAKAPDIAERINNGEYLEVSMGCKVKYDVCSECGNRAPTRKQYCECLKYYLGRLHPRSGRKVYARNPKPVFFDISFVLIGADKIAKTLKKVASSATARAEVVGSALLAEKWATMVKEVPADAAPASQDAVEALVRAIPEVKAQEAPFPKALLDALAQHRLPEVFSTMVALRMLPKPQEFQRIILVSIGRKDTADSLDERNLCFDPAMTPQPLEAHRNILSVSPNYFNADIMKLLAPYMGERSYALPHLAKRITSMAQSPRPEHLPTFITKEAADQERSPVPMWKIMALTAGLYAVLGHRAPEETAGVIDRLIRNNPGLFVALTGAVPFILNQMAGAGRKGHYDAAPLENPDVSDIVKRIAEREQNPILKVGSGIDAFVHRAVLGIPVTYGTSTLLQKSHNMNPQQQEGMIQRTIRKYPDRVSAVLLGDATLALFGKDTFSRIKRLRKTAAFSDYMENGVMWPTLAGSKGLPGRVLIALSEQAAVDGSKKLLRNKSNKPNNNQEQ